MAIILLASCNPKPRTTNFYYFQTSYALTPEEKNALGKLGTKKLYLRLFDVDINPRTGNPEIISPVRIKEEPDPGLEIVPLIFITNKTFRTISEGDFPKLYHQIESTLAHYDSAFADRAFREFQFDCDWTASTQTAYFALLDYFTQAYPQKKISSTIRLHQLKTDNHMKPPPVEHGVLMCYNTGDIRSFEETNSILSREVNSTYLPYLRNYPIRLDIALPLFSWGVQFRYGEIVNLLRDLPASALNENEHVEHIAQNKYRVTESHYLNDQYVYKNDVIRYEAVSQKELVSLAELIRKHQNEAPREVIFYHLKENIVKEYPLEFLQNLSQSISR